LWLIDNALTGLLKEIKMNNANLIPNANWQTQQRGSNDQEYQIYLACADNGKGGDITRNGAPLLSYDDWLNA
jgi:hypothetical protein